MFTYPRQVQFYETDLMGIVHHSNYLRFFEEARVAWAHYLGVLDYQQKESAYFLAVLETQVRHLRPGSFGERIEIDLEAKLEGIRISFQYRIRSLTQGVVLALGQTVHVSLNLELRPIKPKPELIKIMGSRQWTETWL